MLLDNCNFTILLFLNSLDIVHEHLIVRLHIFKQKCRIFVLLYSDGAGRTGTYIAISNLLQRMKIEQAMDVFQTIKIMREAQPQFVENAVSTSREKSDYARFCTG